MKKRSLVLLMLVLISVITFLDRINITMASGDIMAELGYTQCRVLTDMSGKARFPMGFAPVVSETAAADAAV